MIANQFITGMFGYDINSITKVLSKEAEKIQRIIRVKNTNIKEIDLDIEDLIVEKSVFQNEVSLAKKILNDLLKYNKKKE